MKLSGSEPNRCGFGDQLCYPADRGHARQGGDAWRAGRSGSRTVGLTWDRYIALQARERNRYLAERTAIPPDALAYTSVSPPYLERAIEQFANNDFPEEAATRYIATAAAHAPFEELKRCCLFQLADEQRHMEIDRDARSHSSSAFVRRR